MSNAEIEFESHGKPTYQVRISYVDGYPDAVFPKQSRVVAEAEARQWLNREHVSRVVIRLPAGEYTPPAPVEPGSSAELDAETADAFGRVARGGLR